MGGNKLAQALLRLRDNPDEQLQKALYLSSKFSIAALEYTVTQVCGTGNQRLFDSRCDANEKKDIINDFTKHVATLSLHGDMEEAIERIVYIFRLFGAVDIARKLRGLGPHAHNEMVYDGYLDSLTKQFHKDLERIIAPEFEFDDA